MYLFYSFSEQAWWKSEVAVNCDASFWVWSCR